MDERESLVERRDNELEALQAIYMDDFQDIREQVSAIYIINPSNTWPNIFSWYNSLWKYFSLFLNILKIQKTIWHIDTFIIKVINRESIEA